MVWRSMKPAHPSEIRWLAMERGLEMHVVRLPTHKWRRWFHSVCFFSCCTSGGRTMFSIRQFRNFLSKNGWSNLRSLLLFYISIPIISFMADTLETESREKVVGYISFEGDHILGRSHKASLWTLIGTLNERLPVSVKINPVEYKFNEIEDLNGRFKGHIGFGNLHIKYLRSGATITGRAGVGDFEIDGETKIIYGQRQD
ncbi:hypothetical protein AX14_008487 [Amanita brunnescens Koide BX004]|nr:hypothetical protein AX14_008487 [Amanita brunnescens Koide BX004]